MVKHMKKRKTQALFLAVLFLTVLSGCRSAQWNQSAAANHTNGSSSPKIVFAQTEHDFGKVAAGAEQSCTFDFINDGGQDLVIERIYASCGCTTTTAGNMIVKPGQPSEISVKFEAGSAGKVKKQVIVYTNDPENPQVNLSITAEIEGSPSRTRNIASNLPSSEAAEKQPPKDTMPPRLKQALRNLNKATGG